MKRSLKLLNFKDVEPKHIEVCIEEKKLSELNQEMTLTYVLCQKDVDSHLFFPKKAEHLAQGSKLWEKTCFECFFFDEKSDEYFELNVSPEGKYDLLSFQKYREQNSKHPPIQIHNLEIKRDQNFATLSFKLHTHFKSAYFISPTVILETHTGQHFFALSHDSDKADFHKKIMKFKLFS